MQDSYYPRHGGEQGPSAEDVRIAGLEDRVEFLIHQYSGALADAERYKAQVLDLERILVREGAAEASYERQLAEAIRERDEARAAFAGAENSLTAEREHSARLSRECQERQDELRAEVERLERLFQQTHGVHHSWVDARHKVAEKQREACADFVRLWRTDPRVGAIAWHSEDAVRATPLVTEGDK